MRSCRCIASGSEWGVIRGKLVQIDMRVSHLGQVSSYMRTYPKKGFVRTVRQLKLRHSGSPKGCSHGPGSDQKGSIGVKYSCAAA